MGGTCELHAEDSTGPGGKEGDPGTRGRLQALRVRQPALWEEGTRCVLLGIFPGVALAQRPLSMAVWSYPAAVRALIDLNHNPLNRL